MDAAQPVNAAQPVDVARPLDATRPVEAARYADATEIGDAAATGKKQAPRASPSKIPQLDGAAPDPELEDGLRLDPEPDPDSSYPQGYRQQPYSANRPWTQYDLDKKTLCASCGKALNVVCENKIIRNCLFIKKAKKKMVLKC